MALSRNKMIGMILLVTLIFVIIFFALEHKEQNNNNNNDMVIIDFYENIPGFEFRNDVVVLHDNKRNVTCWVYDYKSMFCISDKDLDYKR